MARKTRTTKQPKVSVITSTYREVADGEMENGRDSMLARTVDSVRAQTLADWELWVVADCPPPEDLRKIEQLLASYEDDRIHLDVTAQRGDLAAAGAAAKILGAGRARSAMLAYLDADNEYLPDHLAQSLALFAQEPDLDVVYCDTHVRLRNHQPNDFLRSVWPFYPLVGPWMGEPFEWRKPEWNEQGRRRQERFNFIDSSDAVMARRAYEEAGGLPELPNYDWQLWRGFLRSGHTRFRHAGHWGVIYWTSSLDHHRRHYMASQISAIDLPPGLPLDLNTMDQLLNFNREGFYVDRHHNG